MVLDDCPVCASACLIAAWQYSLSGRGIVDLLWQSLSLLKACSLLSSAKFGCFLWASAQVPEFVALQQV